MDDWNVRLTMAATIATLPRRQGLRKCTVSTLAVTTGPRATVLAARPAQMSIQLSTCGRERLGVDLLGAVLLLHGAARERPGGQVGADVGAAQRLRGLGAGRCCTVWGPRCCRSAAAGAAGGELALTRAPTD